MVVLTDDLGQSCVWHKKPIRKSRMKGIWKFKCYFICSEMFWGVQLVKICLFSTLAIEKNSVSIYLQWNIYQQYPVVTCSSHFANSTVSTGAYCKWNHSVTCIKSNAIKDGCRLWDGYRHEEEERKLLVGLWY